MYMFARAFTEVNSTSNYTYARGANQAQRLIYSPVAGMATRRHKPTAPLHIHDCAITDEIHDNYIYIYVMNVYIYIYTFWVLACAKHALCMSQTLTAMHVDDNVSACNDRMLHD